MVAPPAGSPHPRCPSPGPGPRLSRTQFAMAIGHVRADKKIANVFPVVPVWEDHFMEHFKANRKGRGEIRKLARVA